MADLMELWFKSRTDQEYVVERQEVESETFTTKGNRFNIFAYPKSQNKPRLIFNTHLDVVPPWFGAAIVDPANPDSFQGYWNEETLTGWKGVGIKEPILIGRGSND